MKTASAENSEVINFYWERNIVLWKEKMKMLINKEAIDSMKIPSTVLSNQMSGL